jgi:Zn-finger nucleic acid-binding protein
MKCPACFNELTEIQVGSLFVDVCQGGCGGIWFDSFELQRADEEQETVGERLLEIPKGERVMVDPARKRSCPRCDGVKLQRHFFSPRRLVEIDECPNCAGYWLDAGELAKIRAEKSSANELAKAKKESLSPEVIRYLYRMKTEGRVEGE